MRRVALIAADILREAASRRWLLALFGLITLMVITLALTLQLELVQGVVASVRLFGSAFGDEVRPPDLAMQPLFEAGTWVLFIAGTLFGALSCADFAPELFTPGRIEQLLALPLKRWELVLGTYVGVLSIGVAASFYTGILFTLLLGLKSGVWSLSLLGAAAAMSTAFCAVYGVMLASASFVRSAALSTALGGLFFVASTTMTHEAFALAFEAGPARTTAAVLTAWLPPLHLLGRIGPALLKDEALTAAMWRAGFSALTFGIACVALAIWNIERRDF